VGADCPPRRSLPQQHAIHVRLMTHDHVWGTNWHTWRNGGTAINRAKVYSKCNVIRVSQRSSPKLLSKTYLSETEREFGVVDLGRLQDHGGGQRQFHRPYPHNHGDYPNGHKEYEWKPATNSFPVHLGSRSGRLASIFRTNLTRLWQTLACISLRATKSPSSPAQSR